MRDPPPAPAPPAGPGSAPPLSEAAELEIGTLEATLPPLPPAGGTGRPAGTILNEGQPTPMGSSLTLGEVAGPPATAAAPATDLPRRPVSPLRGEPAQSTFLPSPPPRGRPPPSQGEVR